MSGRELEVSGAHVVAFVTEDGNGTFVSFDGGAVEGVSEGDDSLG